MERAAKQQWVKWEEARQWGGKVIMVPCSCLLLVWGLYLCPRVTDSSQTDCKMSLGPPITPHMLLVTWKLLLMFWILLEFP